MYSFSRASSRFGDARSGSDYMASASCMATAIWHIADGRIGILARLNAARETGPFASARPDCYAYSVHIAVAIALRPKYVLKIFFLAFYVEINYMAQRRIFEIHI